MKRLIFVMAVVIACASAWADTSTRMVSGRMEFFENATPTVDLLRFTTAGVVLEGDVQLGDAAGDTITIAGTATFTGPFATTGDFTVTLDAATDEIDILNTNTTGQSGVPMLFINDDRTGTNANANTEASIMIDAEGTHALYVVDGTVDFAEALTAATVAGTDVTLGNSTGSFSVTSDTTQFSATDAADDVFQVLNATGSVVYIDLDLGAADAFTLGNTAGTTAITSSDWAISTTGAITNVSIDLEANAITSIADTEILIGTGAGTANYAAVSGDATLANTGALTIAADVVDGTELADTIALDAAFAVNGVAGSGGAGGAITVTGGVGDTNFDGGAIAITAGGGAGTGDGAQAALTGGASGGGVTGNGGGAHVGAGSASSDNGNGGAAQLTGGDATGTGTGGAAQLTGGNSAGVGGTAGGVTINPGAPVGGTAGAFSAGGTNAFTSVTFATDGTGDGEVVLPGSSIGDGEIVDVPRSINLPLPAWVDVSNSDYVDWAASDGTAPDFVSTTPTIAWDEDTDGGGANEADTDHIGTTFIVPPDYASGGSLRVRATKSGHSGVPEQLNATANINAAGAGSAGTATTSSLSSTLYVLIPDGTYASGDSVTVEVWVDDGSSGSTADEVVVVWAIEWMYTATQ